MEGVRNVRLRISPLRDLRRATTVTFIYFVTSGRGNVEGIPYRRRLLVSRSSHFIRSDIRVSDTCRSQKILDFLFTCMLIARLSTIRRSVISKQFFRFEFRIEPGVFLDYTYCFFFFFFLYDRYFVSCIHTFFIVQINPYFHRNIIHGLHRAWYIFPHLILQASR